MDRRGNITTIEELSLGGIKRDSAPYWNISRCRDREMEQVKSAYGKTAREAGEDILRANAVIGGLMEAQPQEGPSEAAGDASNAHRD